MVKTNRFDGFRFSFIQIARLLKRIFLLLVDYLKATFITMSTTVGSREKFLIGRNEPGLNPIAMATQLVSPLPG
jgi:hypothetical protein